MFIVVAFTMFAGVIVVGRTPAVPVSVALVPNVCAGAPTAIVNCQRLELLRVARIAVVLSMHQAM